jgi:putative ABC transport system permease protein
MDYLSEGQVVFGMYPPTPVFDKLVHDIPQVEFVSRVYLEQAIVKSQDDVFRANQLMRVDKDFFNVFDFKTASGETGTLFSGHSNIAITKRAAEKFYKNQDPIGKAIQFSDGKEFIVSAVVDTPPSNSSLTFDFIRSTTPADSITWKFTEVPPIYFTLKKRDDKMPDEIVKNLQAAIDQNYGAGNYRLEAVALEDQYFRQGLLFLQHGDKEFLRLFFGIAVVVLLISIINYANLATAQIIRRAKSISIRKIIGSSKIALLSSIISELCILVFASMLLAAITTYLTLPAFSQMVGQEVQLTAFPAGGIVLFVIAIFIVMVGLGAIYPAFQIFGINPLNTLRDVQSRQNRKAVVRQALTILQLVVTIGLICSTLILRGQMKHLSNMPLGFDKENVLSVKIDQNGKFPYRSYGSFREQLMQLGEVQNVTVGPMPAYDMEVEGVVDDAASGAKTKAYVYKVDEHFIESMKILLLSGRDFESANQNDGILVNETAAKLFFHNDALGKTNKFLSKKPVIGIVKDFHFAGARNPVAPLVIDRYSRGFKKIQIRFNSKPSADQITRVRALWQKNYPDQVFEASFLGDDFDDLYQTEKRIVSGFTVFSIGAVVIACLGVVSLASYVLKSKSKELSIRRIYGASVAEIFAKNLRYFLILVGIAMAISIPLIYLASVKYLERYTNRIQIGISYLGVGAFLTLMLVIATVGTMCLQSARANPLSHIREE